MKSNFSLSGMPDFAPLQMKRRQYVLSIIEKKFIVFGFSPISTSLVEKRSNLFGSYGEDGEKLIFQILRSGDYWNKASPKVKKLTSKTLSPLISNKSLRYDLTVPFARFIAENRASISFPFRRYEIGSVFRADRPQKGRLRQFTQCDADIIGSQSLWLEVDLINLISTVFNILKLKDVIIKISNRKLLEGIFESFSSNLNFSQFCIVIDKLDKAGFDKVGELLLDGGLSQKDVIIIKNLFLFRGSFLEKKDYVMSQLNTNTKLKTGFDELSFIFDKTDYMLLNNSIELDFSLARGLDYYTGSIFEVVSSSNNVGSLVGGGRYDQLTEKFNLKNISGVGISFGLDRLCLALEESNLFPKELDDSLKFLFINFGESEAKVANSYILKLRDLGVSAELYPESLKLNKQMSYANKRDVKFVIMIGEEEIKKDKLTIKNMLSGVQELISFKQLIKKLKIGR